MNLREFSWLAWLAAVLLALSLTRNPVYLLLLLVVVAFTGGRMPVRSRDVLPFAPLRLLLVLVPLAALFNALTAHFGETVFLRLPQGIPLLGGAVTLEGLLFGALNGLVLGGMILAFQVFNRALPLRAVLRLVPRAFYPLAVMASIAVTFVPLTVRQWKQIRAAQAVRGHRVRGLRDLPPLFLPLLVGSLERALQLAETLAARGFAARSLPLRKGEQLALSGGLGALLLGWLLAAAWGARLTGWALMAAGAAAQLTVLFRRGRAAPRTAYRVSPARPADALTLAGALACALVWLWPGAAHQTLAYTPYPRLHPPQLTPSPAAALLLLLLPALFPRSDDDE